MDVEDTIMPEEGYGSFKIDVCLHGGSRVTEEEVLEFGGAVEVFQRFPTVFIVGITFPVDEELFDGISVGIGESSMIHNVIDFVRGVVFVFDDIFGRGHHRW